MKKFTNFSLALGCIIASNTLILSARQAQSQVITNNSSIGFTGVLTGEPNFEIPLNLSQDRVLNFINNEVNITTGSFNNGELLKSPVTFSSIDLDFNSQSGNIYNYQAQSIKNDPFIEFINTTIGTESGDLMFILNNENFDFEIDRKSNSSFTGQPVNQLLGILKFDEEYLGDGILTINKNGGAQNYSATLEVIGPKIEDIPEPSALVGLVGVLGLGALIKKGKKSA